MKNNTKKQDILTAYAQVIEKNGLEGASLGALARHMGINQSLVFHYFENKDDLTAQLTEQVAEMCLESYGRAMPEGAPYSAGTFEKYVAYVLRIHSNRRRVVSPKLYFTLTYLIPRNGRVRDSFTQLSDGVADAIAGELDNFARAGVINTKDEMLAARTLMCLADGILCYDEITPPDILGAIIDEQKRLFYTSVGYMPAG